MTKDWVHGVGHSPYGRRTLQLSPTVLCSSWPRISRAGVTSNRAHNLDCNRTVGVGMHVAYAKRMRLYHREGHSKVLDTTTARLCLMSQPADGKLMHTTVPHAASYFCLSKGSPRICPITSCPCLHLCQWLCLEVNDFEAGWPVIDSDF